MIALLTLLLIVSYVLYRKSKWKTLEPLFSKKYNFGKRQKTFQRTLDLLHERRATCLIETGVARYGLKNSKSDGASTAVFGLWAKKNSAVLHAVDISPESIKGACSVVEKLGLTEEVKLTTGDSIKFLENYKGKVDFIYLDSYDYDSHDESIQLASQEHHLKEFKAIENKLTSHAVVLIDDCDLPNGGKGKSVVKYMINKGWSIDTQAYQILLIKND